MTSENLVVAVSREIPSPGIAPLVDAGFDVRYREIDSPADADELAAICDGAHGLFALLTERVDAALLDRCPSLRVVANMAVGYDNIDSAAARQRGVTVTNTPDVLTDATADLAWALLLSAARRLPEGETLVRSGAWEGWRPTELIGVPVGGQTLGIFGMGKIGAAVARRGRGFGMSVLYTNRSRNEAVEAELGAAYVPFDELCERSDIISINAPMTDETRHAFDARAFGLMKSTAILVNTARGPLVDESALVEALESGRIQAAGLDVFEHEPAIHPRLPELDNVALAPHLGSSTTQARAAMVQLASDNIIEVLSGRAPITPVN